MIIALSPNGERPRREYWEQNEGDKSTLPNARAAWHQTLGQGFTLRGHRLSNLYRKAHQSALTLMGRKHVQSSFCQKYSIPTMNTGATPGRDT